MQYKYTVQTIQNTINTSTHYENTHTYTHTTPHITKQVKTATVQDIQQMHEFVCWV
jgi:hypothetical protein